MIRLFHHFILTISIMAFFSSAFAQQTTLRTKYDIYVESLFKKYDLDKDGKLSQEEAKKIRTLPRGADKDGDGSITQTELIESYVTQDSARQSDENRGPRSYRSSTRKSSRSRESSKPSLTRTELYAEAVVTKYDLNKDGKISQIEATQTRSLPPGADKNEDGFITKDELVESYGGRKPETDPAAKNNEEQTRLQKLENYVDAVIKKYDLDADGKLSQEEAKKIRSTQPHADSNGDGVITKEELIVVYGGPKPTSTNSSSSKGSSTQRSSSSSSLDRNEKIENYAEKMLTKYDLDKDGKLSPAEAKKGKFIKPVADANGDGYITKQELIVVYGGPKPSEEKSRLEKIDRYAETIIKIYDLDNDRKISKEEKARIRSLPLGADKNKDGFIAREELVESYGGGKHATDPAVKNSKKQTRLQKIENYVDEVIKSYDLDKDGRISKKEAKMVRSLSRGADKNENGFITKEELVESYGSPNSSSKRRSSTRRSSSSSSLDKIESYAESIINKYDLDKDKKLSQEEAKEMLSRPSGTDTNDDGFITKQELIVVYGGPKPTSSKPPKDISEAGRTRSLLRKNGIAPNSSSVIEYLKRQRPDESIQHDIAKLIVQLGDARFDHRDAASKKLATYGIAAQPQLHVASQSGNPQVMWNARKLLRQIASRTESSLHTSLLIAAIKFLKENPTTEAVSVLLALEESKSTTACDDLVKEAIWAATNQSHAPLLMKALDHENNRVRSTAIVAVEIALGANALPTIKKYLSDGNPRIRLSAARAFVDHDPQLTIQVLSELLSSDSNDVTWQAHALLCAVTGRQCEFGEKETLAKKWKDWLEKNPSTAKLKTPVGKARLSVIGTGNLFREQFSLDAMSITNGYGRFAFETAHACEGSVRDGVLRLAGNHNHVEADQRVLLLAKDLTGNATWPDQFELRVRAGGEASRSGAYHVGVSVGKVKILFHPGYRGGGFRIENVDTHEFLTQNESMPFLPTSGKLCPITLKVKRTETGTWLDILVEPPVGSNAIAFSKQYKVTNRQLGEFDRIALERSGRRGGDALFDSFELRLGR